MKLGREGGRVALLYIGRAVRIQGKLQRLTWTYCAKLF